MASISSRCLRYSEKSTPGNISSYKVRITPSGCAISSGAKKIKTTLRISERPLSVSYVGIRQLQETFGIAGKKALVVGSGRTATLALRYLYEYGASHVTVCSRTFSHAGNLLHEFPTLTIIPFEKRYEAMKECELVVSATASPHHIIREKDIQLLHPTAILDLASPRDGAPHPPASLYFPADAYKYPYLPPEYEVWQALQP